MQLESGFRGIFVFIYILDDVARWKELRRKYEAKLTQLKWYLFLKMRDN